MFYILIVKEDSTVEILINQPGNLNVLGQANDVFPFAKCNQFQKQLSPEIGVSVSEN